MPSVLDYVVVTYIVLMMAINFLILGYILRKEYINRRAVLFFTSIMLYMGVESLALGYIVFNHGVVFIGPVLLLIASIPLILSVTVKNEVIKVRKDNMSSLLLAFSVVFDEISMGYLYSTAFGPHMFNPFINAVSNIAFGIMMFADGVFFLVISRVRDIVEWSLATFAISMSFLPSLYLNLGQLIELVASLISTIIMVVNIITLYLIQMRRITFHGQLFALSLAFFDFFMMLGLSSFASAKDMWLISISITTSMVWYFILILHEFPNTKIQMKMRYPFLFLVMVNAAELTMGFGESVLGFAVSNNVLTPHSKMHMNKSGMNNTMTHMASMNNTMSMSMTSTNMSATSMSNMNSTSMTHMASMNNTMSMSTASMNSTMPSSMHDHGMTDHGMSMHGMMNMRSPFTNPLWWLFPINPLAMGTMFSNTPILTQIVMTPFMFVMATTMSPFYVIMMGAEMSYLVYERYRHAKDLGVKRWAIVILLGTPIFGVLIPYYTNFYVFGMSGMIFHVTLLPFIISIIAVILATTLFGRRAYCNAVCMSAHMWTNVFYDQFKPKKTSIIWDYLRWIFVILMVVAFSLYAMMELKLWSPPKIGMAKLDPLDFYGMFTLNYIWWIFFFLTPVFGAYSCARQGWCGFGTFTGIFNKVLFKVKAKNGEVCKACDTHACESACPIKIPISSDILRKGYTNRISCIGCGDCVEGCTYNNLEIVDVTNYLGRKNKVKT